MQAGDLVIVGSGDLLKTMAEARPNAATNGKAEVYMFGDVPRPGVYSLPREGLLLSRMVAVAGINVANTKQDEILLIRKTLQGQAPRMRVELSGILSGSIPDVPLVAGDVIGVGPAQKFAQPATQTAGPATSPRAASQPATQGDTQPAKPAKKPNVAVGDIELSKPITVDAAVWIFSDQRWQNGLRVGSLRFDQEGQTLKVTLRATLLSWPKARYTAVLELLDANDKVAVAAQQSLESAGIVFGQPLAAGKEIVFHLSTPPDKNVTRFRLTLSIDSPRDSQPTSTPATAPANDAWRGRFKEVYRLEGQQTLKRIPPPFIPERNDYYRNEESEQWSIIKSAPDYFVLYQGAYNELPKGGLGFIDRTTLSHVLRHVIGLGRQDFDGPDKLLNIDLPGDWVLRKGASHGQLLADLMDILRNDLGRSIRFEQRLVERDVIVVRGRFVFTPQSGAYSSNGVHIYAETLDKNEGDGGGSGSLAKFLQQVGSQLNITIIDQTDPYAKDLSWFYNQDTRYVRMGDRREELVQKVLSCLH
jgi:hypothetical protein